MKILITGASGFLGRRAAAHFSSLGYQVLSPSHRQMDITDSTAVNAWFHRNDPQAVIHCAAVSDTGLCQQEPDRTGRINVTGSVNLAKICALTGAKLVFCSSDQVYAGSALPGPHGEQEILTPGNIYARQKLLAEQQCAAHCPDTVSLRLSWMYSTELHPNDHGHLMTTLLSAFRDESQSLCWPIHDRRGITNVEEIAKQLPAALSLPAGVYNFGAENDMDTFHTMKWVFSQPGLDQMLRRLQPNTTAFSGAPRDIRMDTRLAASYGIRFSSTRDGLIRALNQIL